MTFPPWEKDYISIYSTNTLIYTILSGCFRENNARLSSLSSQNIVSSSGSNLVNPFNNIPNPPHFTYCVRHYKGACHVCTCVYVRLFLHRSHLHESPYFGIDKKSGPCAGCTGVAPDPGEPQAATGPPLSPTDPHPSPAQPPLCPCGEPVEFFATEGNGHF